MTSQTVLDYRSTIQAEIRTNVEPQSLEVHHLTKDVASAASTPGSRDHPSDVNEGIANNITLESKHQPKQQQHQSPRQHLRTTILPASGVTTGFDELRFEAAAARQLRLWTPPVAEPLSSIPEQETELLISSPYNHPQHLLDLKTLDTQNRLLALALAALKPIRPDYATADYLETFNWPDVLRILRLFAGNEGFEWRESRFYTVVFRSKLNAVIDAGRLGDLDQHSHREATESGGLLKYWFGKASLEGRENLATCEFPRLTSLNLGFGDNLCCVFGLSLETNFRDDRYLAFEGGCCERRCGTVACTGYAGESGDV